MEVLSSVKRTSGGRRKIPMKKIADLQSLRVSLTKRKNTLFKKAAALKKSCGLEVAVFIQYPSGNFKVSGDDSEIRSIIDQYLSGSGSSCSGAVGAGAASSSFISGGDHQVGEFKGSVAVDQRSSCSADWVIGTSSFVGGDHQVGEFKGSVEIDRRSSCSADWVNGTNSFGVGDHQVGECKGSVEIEQRSSCSADWANGTSSFGAPSSFISGLDHQIVEFKGSVAVDQRSSCSADWASGTSFGGVGDEQEVLEGLVALDQRPCGYGSQGFSFERGTTSSPGFDGASNSGHDSQILEKGLLVSNNADQGFPFDCGNTSSVGVDGASNIGNTSSVGVDGASNIGHDIQSLDQRFTVCCNADQGSVPIYNGEFLEDQDLMDELISLLVD